MVKRVHDLNPQVWPNPRQRLFKSVGYSLMCCAMRNSQDEYLVRRELCWRLSDQQRWGHAHSRERLVRSKRHLLILLDERAESNRRLNYLVVNFHTKARPLVDESTSVFNSQLRTHISRVIKRSNDVMEDCLGKVGNNYCEMQHGR